MVTETWKANTYGEVPNQQVTGVRAFQVSGVYTDAKDIVAAVKAFSNIDINTQWGNSGEEQYLLCQSMIPHRISGNMAEVICSYAIPVTGHYEPTADPLSLPYRYEWQPVTDDIPFDRDVDNNPVLNSGYFPPSTPPRKKILYWRLSVFFNAAFFDFANYKVYANTCNSDTIEMNQPDGQSVQFDPGTMFCNYVRPTRAYTANDKYIPMEALIDIYDLSQINITDPFQYHMLDVGTAGWYSSGGSKFPGRFVYGDETDVTTDVPLDGTGKPVVPKNGQAVYVANSSGDKVSPVAAPNGTPKGATIENSGNTDFPAVYLRWKRYAKIPLLPLLTPNP